MMSKQQVNSLREQYPKGTIVELHAMRGEDQMPSGLKGEVEFVDDAGQIHTKWSNGSTLALLPGEDSFSIVREQEQTQSMRMDM